MKKFLFYFCCTFLCFANNAKSITSSTTKTYTQDGNTYTASISFTEKSGKLSFNGNGVSSTQDVNYIVVDDEGNITKEGFYYPNRITYIFDSNNQIIAKKSSWTGDIVETYKYTDTGKPMRYNINGELLGAYKDFIDMEMSSQRYDYYQYNDVGFSNYIGNKTLTDTEGNFKDVDSSGKVLGVYYQNGDYVKNKYNSNGSLLSSSKYDKDGNVKESSVNKYDGGGNLVQAYENGKLIYAKEIYTPAEAAAATRPRGNTVSITW